MDTGIKEFRKFQKAKETEELVIIALAWYYSRVSGKYQFDNNKSLENQTTVCYSYAKQHDINITKELGGTYESASGDFTRKEFMRLINEVKRSRKRPKYILIFIMSRFSRTGGNAIALANMLVEDLGVHLIETSTGLSTETEHGKLAIYKKLISAREETLERLRSITPGMKTALRSGKWLGAVPKGYTKFGPNVTEEKRFAARTRIEINEDGEVLRKAWKWKTRGEKDYIIKEMLEQYDLSYSLRQLHKLWQKPFYAGILVHNMIDEPVKGNWEALVSKKDFLLINDRLQKNKRTENGYEKTTENDPRPLSGHLICGDCNSPLYGYEKRKKKANGEINRMHYYKCYNCGKVHINANTSKFSSSKVIGIHDQFKSILSEHKIKEKYNEPISLALVKMIEAKDIDLNQDIPAIKKKITILKGEFKIIKKRWAIEKIDEDSYQEFKLEYAKEIDELEKRLPKKDLSTANLLKMTKNIVSVLSNLDVVWDSVDSEEKKDIQKALFPKGLVVEAENRQLRTLETNSTVSLISSMCNSYGENKKGTTQLILGKSPSAERGGFEPPVQSIAKYLYISLILNNIQISSFPMAKSVVTDFFCLQ